MRLRTRTRERALTRNCAAAAGVDLCGRVPPRLPPSLPSSACRYYEHWIVATDRATFEWFAKQRCVCACVWRPPCACGLQRSNQFEQMDPRRGVANYILQAHCRHAHAPCSCAHAPCSCACMQSACPAKAPARAVPRAVCPRLVSLHPARAAVPGVLTLFDGVGAPVCALCVCAERGGGATTCLPRAPGPPPNACRTRAAVQAPAHLRPDARRARPVPRGAAHRLTQHPVERTRALPRAQASVKTESAA